jgi:hypothetical protein
MSAPAPDPVGVPPQVLAAIRAELRTDEQLVWAAKPRLAGYAKELLLAYPMCLVAATVIGVGGWFFYSWAQGAGALNNIRCVLILAVIGLFVVSLLVGPPLWPLRLRRSWYALTTQRVVLRVPALLIVWPRIRTLDPAGCARVRVVIWTWLPDGTGDIIWDEVPAAGTAGPHWPKPGMRMERVPRAEEVAELIRRTLALPPSGADAGAAPSTEGPVS